MQGGVEGQGETRRGLWTVQPCPSHVPHPSHRRHGRDILRELADAMKGGGTGVRMGEES